MRGRLAHGASVVLTVNGTVLGRVFDLDWSVETPATPIHGLDSVVPFELAPGATLVSGVIRLYRLERDGGAEGAGLTVPTGQLLQGRYVSLQLIDRRGQSVLFQTDNAWIGSQRWSAPVKGLVTGTVSFNALLYTNEMS